MKSFFRAAILVAITALLALGQPARRPGGATTPQVPAAEAAKSQAAETSQTPAKAAQTAKSAEGQQQETQAAKLEILTGELVPTQVGRMYEMHIEFVGGKPPYKLEATGGPGSIRASLCESSSTSLCGTADREGKFEMALTLKDSGDPQQEAAKKLTLTVNKFAWTEEDRRRILSMERAILNSIKGVTGSGATEQITLSTIWNELPGYTEHMLNFRRRERLHWKMNQLALGLALSFILLAALVCLAWWKLSKQNCDLARIVETTLSNLPTSVNSATTVWPRKGRPPEPTREDGGANWHLTWLIPIACLLALLGLQSAFGQQTPPPAPPPAITDIRIVGATHVVQGKQVYDAKTKAWKPVLYTLVLAGRNIPADAKLILPEDCTAEGDSKVTRTSVLAKMHCSDKSPEGLNQAGIETGGQKYYPPDTKGFMIISLIHDQVMAKARESIESQVTAAKKQVRDLQVKLEAQAKIAQSSSTATVGQLAAQADQLKTVRAEIEALKQAQADSASTADQEIAGLKTQVRDLQTARAAILESLGQVKTGEQVQATATIALGDLVAEIGNRNVKTSTWRRPKPILPGVEPRVEAITSRLRARLAATESVTVR